MRGQRLGRLSTKGPPMPLERLEPLELLEALEHREPDAGAPRDARHLEPARANEEHEPDTMGQTAELSVDIVDLKVSVCDRRTRIHLEVAKEADTGFPPLDNTSPLDLDSKDSECGVVAGEQLLEDGLLQFGETFHDGRSSYGIGRIGDSVDSGRASG